MMLAHFGFGMEADSGTKMSHVRELIARTITQSLGDGQSWEFFLPDSGAFVKRELESMISLCDYMDECNFGRQLSVRVVDEHGPAIVQVHYLPSFI